MGISIYELRHLCQDPIKSKDLHLVSLFYRKISIYLTRILLFTPITANQVTILGLIIGIISAFFFSGGNYLIGAFLFMFAILLDFSDGEIARYRNNPTIKGVFLDIISHYIIDPLMFLGISIGVFKEMLDPSVLVLGGVSAVCVMLIRITRDAKIIAPLQSKTHISTKSWNVTGDTNNSNSLTAKILQTNIKSFIPYLSYNAAHLIFLLSLVNFLVPFFNLVSIMYYLILFYGITYPVACAIWIWHSYNEF